MDWVSGPKCDRREELERLSRLDLEAKSPRDRGQQKHGLHHREVIANADPRPITEGKICATG